MAIDIHALNLIRYSAMKKPLGRVATIGRLGLEMPNEIATFGHYCEEFLAQRFHATAVDSYDYSTYEGATYAVDMNRPIVPLKTYDTLLDCGCLEHIYNIAQAFANVSALCDKGGQIIHMLPANNFCGHGFWQMSPELFFSLYSAANGYAETEVFLVDLTKPDAWYEVLRPTNGRRAEALSRAPVYVLCRTVKTSEVSSLNVQQSDYLHVWSAGNISNRSADGAFNGVKQLVKRNHWLYSSALAVRQRLREFKQRVVTTRSFSTMNPHLRRRSVNELLMRSNDRTEVQQ